ncbi:DUF938 domain-containing protein [Novosphingobium sp. PS1R-30]|uniref:DUF938 domain-containing protein n=1 Tax=Novosphingobium anseongense TaxID=3133436 RepID=A0ABU8RY85_9SPHN
MKPDSRRSAPATQRNRDPILDVLRTLLPETGLALEVASGTGEHVIHFARAFPYLRWQPSDPTPDARASIAAWTETNGLMNVLPPLDLDAAADAWPVASADALLCINMIHISPWEATEGLMRGAGRLLNAGQPVYLYGPYRRADRPLAPSNAAFDADLKRRDSRWGLRELDDVVTCAEAEGLALEAVIEMPANNLSVIFRKR